MPTGLADGLALKEVALRRGGGDSPLSHEAQRVPGPQAPWRTGVRQVYFGAHSSGSCGWVSSCRIDEQPKTPVFGARLAEFQTYLSESLASGRMGSNSSTGLPAGSSTRICLPPTPVTKSLRKWARSG